MRLHLLNNCRYIKENIINMNWISINIGNKNVNEISNEQNLLNYQKNIELLEKVQEKVDSYILNRK